MPRAQGGKAPAGGGLDRVALRGPGDGAEMLAHHWRRRSSTLVKRGSRPTSSSCVHVWRCAMRATGRWRSAPDRRPHHYAAALALWPRDDPEWPQLVIATADAGLSMTSDEMSEALEQARDRLEATGDLAGAAKAEMLNGFRYWNEARSERALAAFAAARSLIERAEPSAAMAHVAARLAIQSMLRSEFDETMAMCERVLRIADQLDSDDLRLHVLNTRGVTRVLQRATSADWPTWRRVSRSLSGRPWWRG